MNYELAKKLKDAGFPRQKVGLMDVVFLNEERSMPIATPEEIEYFFNHRTDFVFIPKLSELIEACDDKRDKRRQSDFELKNRIYSGGNAMVWGANVVYSDKRVDEIGDTPEEAVANLWLAIKSA